jgi:hypothetical protein
MKLRREQYDDEARRLMGISGVKVYEVRNCDDESRWYYAIVWGGRERYSVRKPWDANRGKLEMAGWSLRSELFQREQEEEMMNSEQKLIDDDARQNADVEKEQISDAKTLLKIKTGSTVSMTNVR